MKLSSRSNKSDGDSEIKSNYKKPGISHAHLAFFGSLCIRRLRRTSVLCFARVRVYWV